MTQVSKAEFDAHVARLNAVPDGFKPNGSYVQTRYFAGGREVARFSQSGSETVYEIA